MPPVNANNEAVSTSSVSVIIPVYKVNPVYFEVCLESVANQVEEGLTVEALVVFDGVPDNSLIAILDQYASKIDLIVRMVEHRGVSAARNIGMCLARGEWISFLDADDELPRHALKLLVDSVSLSPSCDIVFGDFYTGPEGEVAERRSYSDCSISASHELALRLREDVLKQGKFAGSVWAKLFKSSFLSESDIQFDESLQVGEDTEFVFRASCKATSVAYCHEVVYCYVRRQGSATLGWRKDYVQRILTSMDAIGKSVSESHIEAQLREELLCSYVAFHLLLIAVHYLFNPCASWSILDRKAEYNRVLDIPIFSKSLNGYNPEDFSAARRVSLIALKFRLFWMSWLISWIRHKQLSRRG